MLSEVGIRNRGGRPENDQQDGGPDRTGPSVASIRVPEVVLADAVLRNRSSAACEDMLKTRCRYAEDVPSGVTALLAAGTK